MTLLYPLPGYFEICTTTLWAKVVHIIKKAILSANLTPADIHCIGITTLRSSFVTWDRETGKEFHNIITWKDLRADDLVKTYNKSFLLMVKQSRFFVLLWQLSVQTLNLFCEGYQLGVPLYLPVDAKYSISGWQCSEIYERSGACQIFE